MLKVGLIGVGGISGAHISAWDRFEDAELVALCDTREGRLENYKGRNLYTSFEDMMANEKLDILDICLPTYMHVEYSLKALEKGINVVCEKPISLNADDIEKVYSAAEKHGVKFMVAQVLRFWDEYEEFKKIYESKKYGSLLTGTVTRLGCRPLTTWNDWMLNEKLSGLTPYDLHIHDLDFLVYAIGAPKKANTYRNSQPKQDYLHAVYEYDGFFITGDASWYDSPYPFTMGFRFQFEKAVVAFENDTFKIYEQGGNIVELKKGNTTDLGDVEFELHSTDAYANELRYFADCVKENKTPDKVKPDELRTVINILNTFR